MSDTNKRKGNDMSKKTEVMKRLNAAKLAIRLLPEKDRWAVVELRMKISHLQSALDNWIDGKSECSFIY